MKTNEFHMYGCVFSSNSRKEYNYISQMKFEVGDVALVEVRDYRTGVKTLKEVEIKSYLGVKELTESELSFFKRILGSNLV